MADEADAAQMQVDAYLESAIERAKRTAPLLQDIGRCHACGATLGSGRRFCDTECREDWDDFIAADKRNGLRR